MAWEAAEKSAAAKEDELAAWRRSQGKWEQELQMRDDMVKGLKASNSKKSSQISKLQENIGHLKHELCERDDMIRYLKEEVEVERWESVDAFERARLVHQSAEDLQDQLREEEAYRVEVIENYHNNTLGKVEVALACKADFDYLMMQLPAELTINPKGFHYPTRVANCLGPLQEIERRGGGWSLMLITETRRVRSRAKEQVKARPKIVGLAVLKRREMKVGSEPRSPPPSTSTAIAPPCSASCLGSSATPASSPTPAPSSTC